MSEDFGTVNVRASARSREIEMIRQHYRAHRDTLGRLAAEAPTEHLAAEYNRLIADIDTSLHKLNELEGRPLAAPSVPPPSSPGSRPLVMTPGEPAPPAGRYDTSPGSGSSSSSRVMLIVLIGVVVLGALAWLIWRASSQRPPSAQRTTTQPVTTSPAPAETGTVIPAATSLTPPT